MGGLSEKLQIRSKKQDSMVVPDRKSPNRARVASPMSSSYGCQRELGLTSNLVKDQAKKPAIIELPVEIFDPILALLDLPSLIRFRQTCRTLYYHGQDLRTLQQDLRGTITADSRFARLCFAERSYTNRLRERNMLLCGGCRIYHSKNSFNGLNRIKQAEERMCFGQNGRLYFTPEHSISFGEMTEKSMRLSYAVRSLAMDTKQESRYGYRRIHDSERATPYLVSPIYQQCSRAYGHCFDYFWLFDIRGSSDTHGSPHSLTERLRKQTVKLCPHIKSNDALLVNAIRRCQRKNVFAHHNASRVICQRCKMNACVMLHSQDPWSADQDQRNRVLVHVARYVGQNPQMQVPRITDYYSSSKGCYCHGQAMQRQWIEQLELIGSIHSGSGSKKDKVFQNFKPERAGKMRGLGYFNFHDHDAEVDWGACPQW